MYIPVLKHIIDAGEVFVERVMPVGGEVVVAKGQEVEPYSQLGVCTFSQKVLRLPLRFRLHKNKTEGKFFYEGNLIGKVGSKKITAPFNGHLIKKTDTNVYEFVQMESRYVLLSGVWGTVHDVVKSNSVLLKTKAKDLLFAASTDTSFAGEIIVFPNPSAVLEKHYLGKFAPSSTEGKIVYVGNHVSVSLIKEAEKLGWGAVIAGSCDKEAFSYAKSKGISFGVFTGFGKPSTPQAVFEFLNGVSNRYVFFEGSAGILRVPMPKDDNVASALDKTPKAKKSIKSSTSIRLLKKGLNVFCVQKPYFGQVGVVDSIKDYSIFVKFPNNVSAVEIKLPNFFIIE